MVEGNRGDPFKKLNNAIEEFKKVILGVVEPIAIPALKFIERMFRSKK